MSLPLSTEQSRDRDRQAWRRSVPVLHDARVTLRELRMSDAPSLFTHLSNPTVIRYTAPPPASVEGFEHFIRWIRSERRRGAQLCYGIVPISASAAMGLIQIRPRERNHFATAEWGFALSESLWGTGLFMASARLALDLAFTRLGVVRLEARAALTNGRGNAALRKLGATCEGTFRRAFLCADPCMDDGMWSILGEEWPTLRHADRADTIVAST